MDELNTSAEIALEAEAQRITSLLLHVRIALVASVFVSSVVMFLLWDTIDNKGIAWWGLLIWAVSLFRFYLGRHFLSEIRHSEDLSVSRLKTQEKHYALGSMLSGCAWAVLAALMKTDWPIESLFLVSFLFAGLSAGALGASISSFINYIAFLPPVFAMLIYRLQSYDFILAALVLAVYLIAALLTAWKLNQLFIFRFGYQVKNKKLIKALTIKTDEQEMLLQQLETSYDFSTDAFENAGVAMALIGADDQFIAINKAFCDLTAHKKEALVEKSSFEVTHLDALAVNQKDFQQLCAGEIASYDLRKRYICADDSMIWVKISLSAIQYDGNFKYAVLHMQNVSQEQKLTQHLTYQAQHDFLTGLPNRYAFDARLIQVVDNVAVEDRRHVLCYLDLDQFKVVNDTCGHLAGDDLLRQVAKLFQSKLRKTDLFARIGGDEFAILLFDCNLKQADVFLQSLLKATREFRFKWEVHTFTIGVSIGTVAVEKNGLTSTEIMKQADSACYAAKEGGRNRVHTFRDDDELVSQLSGEMHWVSRLQSALEEGELIIYQQAITPTDSKDIRPHCELLVRLKEKDGTIIYPGAFLPAAERYNMSAKLDLWVVGQVLHTLEQARKRKKEIAGIYGVNLSGASLGDTHFQENVISIVKQYHLPDAFICFEITETAAIANLDKALKFIHALRELGCQFALDDFGSGLSSFAYLKQMPVDYLKIDGVFVKDCVTDRINFSMIEAINDIGHVMGISTVAEFVENDEIFHKLRGIGVDYAQGYWKGPPLPWVID